MKKRILSALVVASLPFVLAGCCCVGGECLDACGVCGSTCAQTLFNIASDTPAGTASEVAPTAASADPEMSY